MESYALIAIGLQLATEISCTIFNAAQSPESYPDSGQRPCQGEFLPESIETKKPSFFIPKKQTSRYLAPVHVKSL